MNPPHSNARNAPTMQAQQRGFVMLAMVVVLMLGVVSVGLTFYRPNAGVADERIGDTFADVKAALIGHAARQGVFQCGDPTDAAACQAQLAQSTKLGEFPCPDITNDGIAEISCATERLGRVPWKTLGIPEPNDSAGETLWYAVSQRFLNNASNPIVKTDGYTSSGALNSSTVGNLTVIAANGATITTTAIAVIFSPGTALGSQNRSSTDSAYCSPSKPNSLRNLCPDSYLESIAGLSNDVFGATVAAGGEGFNDRLAFVTAAEVIPLLEMRLGNELRDLLLEYKYSSECLCYPWAGSWKYSGGIPDVGINRGRLPTTAKPEDWGTGKIPRFPTWVMDNDWHKQVYYSASEQETDNTGSGCLSCSANPTLTVQQKATANVLTDRPAAVVMITPGTPRPGVQRPYIPSEAANSPLADVFASYFEDAFNDKSSSPVCPGIDGGSLQTAQASCDAVVVPQSRAYDRDRVWRIDPENPLTMCPRAGPALVRQVPCKDGSEDKIRDVCTNLVTKLKQCSHACADAAAQMIVVPCRNNTSSSQCPGPAAALLACKAT